MAKKSKDDTGQLPPGDDFGDDLPDRGQSLNHGYGYSGADLERGHQECPKPDSSHELDKYSEPKGGFLRRTTFGFER